MKVLIVFFLTTLICLSCQKDNTIHTNSSALFQLIDSKSSGIDFQNNIKDQPDFNILNYRNFYNGGGVAIGDINNDGLDDIYFTANQEKNRLYLNQGDFKFKDMTEQAKVSGSKAWSTGVTMVDINADGWLDIYVCNSGDVKGDNKANELFLNQKDGTFKEVAAQWNLDNEGFTTHASFFDYDQDGDLDCYILNNSFRSPDRIEFYKKQRSEVHLEGGDKLMRNDGDSFTDVTTEAGIYSSDIGFGLGVSVSDLNGDMLPDIYVSNDFWERDYLYINQGNGTFSEELTQRLSICSFNSMGADIADLNNDGAAEIMTTDMLPADNYRLKTMTQFEPYRLENEKVNASYHYQMLQNCLQVNDGQANFQEQAFLAGVGATDWSWGALMLDLNNDGWKDIFVSNGIYRDLTDFDFVDFISNEENIRAAIKKGDALKVMEKMPSVPLSNYAFISQEGQHFKNQAIQLGLAEPSFSNGAAYGDLDNDGDLDLVVNNVNRSSFIYKNQTREQNGGNYLKVELKGSIQNPTGIGAKVRIKANDQWQETQHFLSRSFESAVAPGLFFGLANITAIDTLQIIWSDLKQQILTNITVNQTLALSYQDANTTYSPEISIPNNLVQASVLETEGQAAIHQENTFNDFDHERLMTHMLSTEGPKILTGDLNGDQLEDFILLGASNDPDRTFFQNRNGTFRYAPIEAFELDRTYESTCGLMVDLDQDGDQDVLIGSGGNEYAKGFQNYRLRYYENIGNGKLLRVDMKAPPATGNFSCIEAADFDLDGDLDLFIGARAVPGNYGLIPRSYFLENEGAGVWNDLTTQAIGTLGMVTDAAWADTDGDGDKDLVVVGEWMPITILENLDDRLEIKTQIPNSEGWWNTIEAVDLDGDNDQDFVLGNWGLNSKLQASPEKPLTMYVKDFDRNGKSEFILNWYAPNDEKSFPYANKPDMVAQLPHLRKSALKYSEYAKKDYEELFTEQERAEALMFKTVHLSSSILWDDQENFRLEALPRAAQVAPVFAILAEDLDEDGIIDLGLFGNFYEVQPSIGRLDGNKGIFFKGNKDKKFSLMRTPNISGAVRDIQSIQIAGKKTYLVGRNNESVLVLK